jgi:hypothetical protein
VSGAETDAELGTTEFQTKYFNNNPLYIDRERKFYEALGNKSLWWQPWSTWNPLQLYWDFQAMSERLTKKGLEGNLKVVLTCCS